MDLIKQFEPLFGDWHAESVIGAGSFGRVYKAYRDELGARYWSAIKYISLPSEEAEIEALRSEGLSDGEIKAHFDALVQEIGAETRLMNRLKGFSNIVSYEDSRIIPKKGGIGYDVFIRMELLESLSARMHRAPLSRNETVALGIDVSRALMICADNGVIHRDIKPDNIFINDHGDFKLGDFGIARRLEKTSAFMSRKGTYNYMAPEVYRAEKYGANCDIYSLGLVMYRFLNRGRLPFLPPAPQQLTPADREKALMHRLTGGRIPVPCDADPALAGIVLKACEYDPAKRYPTAEALCRDLMQYKTLYSGVAPRPETAPEDRIFADDTSDDPASAGKANAVRPNNAAQIPNGAAPPRPNNAEQIPNGAAPPRPNDGAQIIKDKAPQAPAEKKKKTGLVIGLIAAAVVLAATAAGIIASKCARGGEQEPEDVKNFVSSEPTVPPKDTDIVEFINPAFENALREATGFTGVLLYSEVRSMESLDLSGKGLTDISDLAKFTGLKELNINNNEITDISPLAGLTQLTDLYMRENGITDVSPLAGMKRMTVLGFGGNNVTDISALAGMTQMEELYIWHNDIEDISVLSNMKGLRLLNAEQNRIKDISALSGLTELFELLLYQNDINDISPLAGLKKLTRLELDGNAFSDISPLRGLAQMETLSLGGNYIADLGPLEDMKNLIELYLWSNEIRDITPLSGLKKLLVLDLEDNYIEDISPLSGLKKLQQLSVADNMVADLLPLKGLTMLSVLYVGNNAVRDISPLKGLTALEELKLDNVKPEDIAPLKNLKALKKLTVTGCSLSEDQLRKLASWLPGCEITR